MTFYYSQDADPDDPDAEHYSKKFKTAKGAISHAATRIPETRYGYTSVDRYTGEHPCKRHVVAEWKRNGRLLATVYCYV